MLLLEIYIHILYVCVYDKLDRISDIHLLN